MNRVVGFISRAESSSVTVTLRRTYFLLSLTLLFSAFIAGAAIYGRWPYPGVLVTLAGSYGLLYLTQSLRNSLWGVVSMFAFSGFMGYTLAPMLHYYLSVLSNGGAVIMLSLGATGIIFLSLSAYVLLTGRDFQFLTGFVFSGIILGLVLVVSNIFLQLPMLSLAISAVFALLACGGILQQTSQIIHGGERNFIMATIGLYVWIYNLFVSLLQLLAAFGGRHE